MTLRQDIQEKIDALPNNLQQPLDVVITALHQQKTIQLSDQDIEQQLLQALKKQVQEDSNDN